MDSAPESPTHTKTEGREVIKYLENETAFMAPAGFYRRVPNAFNRRHAVSIIAKHSKTDDYDAFIPYLAMNYFDRYFSKAQFQYVKDVTSDAEKVCLIALCCLFISAKIRTKTFSIDQFLRDKSINFSMERILEMELNILQELNWRMQPVTAFSYLNYFYRYFKSLGGFKRRCIYEIIVQAQGENQFVYYKPSQIAMSAFLAAAEIAYPSKVDKLLIQIPINVPNDLLVVCFQKEELSKCVRLLRDLCARKNIKIDKEKETPIRAKDKGEIEEITEEETPRLARSKEEQENIAIEAATKLGMQKEKVPTLTFDVKWPTFVPFLERGSLKPPQVRFKF